MHWQGLILFLTLATLGLWLVVDERHQETDTRYGNDAAMSFSPSSLVPAAAPFTLNRSQYDALIKGIEYAALSYQLENNPSRTIRVGDIGFSKSELESYALSPSTTILMINDQPPAALFKNFHRDYLTRGLLKLELESTTGPVTVAWRPLEPNGAN